MDSMVFIRQEEAQDLNQRSKMLLDDAPDQAVIDRGVGVNQHIAHGHGLGQVRNLHSGVRIGLAQLVQRFANDLQLSFDSGAQQLVCEVVVKRLPRNETQSFGGGLLGVPEIFGGVRRHTQPPAPTQSACADTDCAAPAA